ncbi:hypothetical protein P43SY_004353 [Pythium insidiosum]|uniref:HAT C-terminal dimerisation domain-containing protein n=1 Tax=Pythium insidiosum TaxID=114742 RepID=A0AAD5LIF5_PYTIN|nr:hypothetical protein P43SY_004353 [Pythium insidiosum]
MSRQLFDRLLHGIVHADDYFEQRPDATGKLGLSAHQKVTAALRVLCYGLAADAVDEYVIVDWLGGNAPVYSFTANGNEYSSCYLLCDGIYPSWSVFMKTISDPSCQKTKLFAKMQEAVRKDVERCFAVLQARFDIVNTPGRFWSVDVLRSIWKACVVMHNMIIEDDELTGTSDDIRDEAAPAQSTARSPMAFDQFLTQLGRLQDETKYAALQRDLVEHMWTEKQKRNLFDTTFDAVILEFPELQRLAAAEEVECGVFRVKAGSDVVDNDQDAPSFMMSAFKKRKLTNRPRYMSLKWVPPTSNVCERLFSKTKFVYSDLRKRLDCETLEFFIFLMVNKEFWGFSRSNVCEFP